MNPRCTFRHIRDFQSRSLDRSDTPPSGAILAAASCGDGSAQMRGAVLEDVRARPARPSLETRSAILRQPRRSGRVAEGGALLRRYGGECLHRGFESLLLRFRHGEVSEWPKERDWKSRTC